MSSPQDRREGAQSRERRGSGRWFAYDGLIPSTEIQELATARGPNDRTVPVLWALAALFVAIRLWNLTAFGLDSDEVFSISTARLGWGDLLTALIYDVVHPPLFYGLLKVWIAIGGTSLVWVRILPLLLSAAALVPLVLIFRKLDLSPAARVLTLAMLAVNDYQVFHARYVRMYSLLFLLSLISLYLFLEWMEEAIFRDDQDWRHFLEWMEEGGRRFAVWPALVDVLLVYTHYYGWMLVAAEGAAVAWGARQRLKEYAAICAGVLVAFLPWAAAVAHSASVKGGLEPNLRWIRRPGVGDLLWFYAGLNGPLAPIPLASVMGVICVVLLGVGLRRASVRRLDVLLAAALLPPLVSFAASYALKDSVWGNRHLILSAVPYMIVLAASVCALRPARLRLAALGLMSGWLVWGAWQVTFRPEPRADLGPIVSRLVRESALEREVTVYSLDAYLPAWMAYHLEAYPAVKWNLVAIREPRAVAGERFWLAYNDKFWHERRRPEEMLRELGYETGPGVEVSDQWNRIALVPVHRRK